jgi:uncharacterized membrane protein HdeD (DUF308 family)
MNLTRKQKANLVKRLFLSGAIIAGIQSLLASSHFPGLSDSYLAIIIGIISILAGLNTAFYQYLHDNIPNRIATSGLLMALASVVGGVNELFNIIPINGTYGVYITYSISAISFLLQLVSKVYYVPNKQ